MRSADAFGEPGSRSSALRTGSGTGRDGLVERLAGSGTQRRAVIVGNSWRSVLPRAASKLQQLRLAEFRLTRRLLQVVLTGCERRFNHVARRFCSPPKVRGI